MKLVIDIPDEDYNVILANADLYKEKNWGVAEVWDAIVGGVPFEPNRVLYLCDGHGCDGCEAKTNEDHHCKHTSDITHARNFEAMTNEETGEVVGYYEKPEHVVAQINFDEDKQKEFADEAAQRIREEIENGELVVKESCRPVIIHHNGRDFNGYFDSSRMLLFGSYLAAEVANDFGFTWTEVEEEDKNHES